MGKLTIQWDERGVPPLSKDHKTLLTKILRTGVRQDEDYGPMNCELSISFVSEEEMHKLNRKHRKKDAPTDVLSFPMAEDLSVADMMFSSRPVMLGDIVVCVDVAEKQAEEYGHSIERELAFLTSHGLLHLLGFVHDEPEPEAKMLSVQKKLLEKVGVPPRE